MVAIQDIVLKNSTLNFNNYILTCFEDTLKKKDSENSFKHYKAIIIIIALLQVDIEDGSNNIKPCLLNAI